MSTELPKYIEPDHLSRWTLTNTLPPDGSVKRAIRLRPYQLKFCWQILQSVVNNDGEEYYAEWSRKSGKTEALADLIHFMSFAFPTVYKIPRFKDGIWIGIFAPSKEQSDIAFGRTKERFNTNIAQKLTCVEVDTSNASQIKLSNGSLVWSMTASDKAKKEGPTFHVVFIEQAEDVSDLRIKKTILPMLTSTNGTRILLGNPTPEHQGYFYESTKHAGDKLFQVDAELASLYSVEYAKYLKKMKKQLGEDSDEYRTQYMLQWISQSSGFIGMDDLRKRKQGRIKDEDFSQNCFVGIDTGKANDSTVVTVLGNNNHILNWLELQGEDYDEQVTIIREFLKHYNGVSGYVDTTAGEPFYDFLKVPYIKPLSFAGRYGIKGSTKSDIYKNLLHFMKHEIYYPEDETTERLKFEQQFTELEKHYKGNILICRKPKRKYAHDDFCDSMAYAFQAKREGLGTFFEPTVGKRM